MARGIRYIDFCDWCRYLGIEEVIATITHVIAVPPQMPREYDLCERCDRVLAPVIDFLHAEGKEVEPPQSPRRPKTAAVDMPKAKELEEAASTAEEESIPKIWCPLPHESERGMGKFITYKTRGQHVKHVHDGLQIWDIEWMDPHKIMQVPCTSHAACKEKGVSFMNQHGLTTHVTKCPLPRLDDPATDTPLDD